MKLYGEITKSEQQDDGTLMVSGIASSEVRDSVGETVTADAMRKAIPDYMKFGAVREMHDAKKAAGTAVEINVNEQGDTEFTAHVVDPVAVKKVLTSVYKGFSIGGKITKRNELNKNILEGINLTEISLVDRPCNPASVFHCFKAEGADGGDELNAVEDDAAAPEAIVEAVVASEEIAEEVVQADADSEKADPAAAIAEEFKTVVVDGKEVTLRKRDDGLFEEVLPVDTLEKGSYSITQLANLAESLEYFAASRMYDSGSESSTIPKEALALAGKLYDMLLTLVGEDVAAAKVRLKDTATKKNEDAEALQKVEGVHEQLLKQFCGAFGNEGDKYEDILNKVAAENITLTKRVQELEAKPAPAKAALRVVNKSDDMSQSGDVVLEKAASPLDLVKASHASGGTVIR